MAAPAAVNYISRVNFQRDTGPDVPGYARDYGQPFDATRGYGWVAQTSATPVSIVGNGRNRNLNLTDERLDTFVHMQLGTQARWETAIANGNIFTELMETVKYCSLGDITNALYSVGGQYRRNM